MADLGYGFLTRQCDSGYEDDPAWLTILGHISLVITAIFLAEISLALFAFGFGYYNPFGTVALAALHLLDAFVIITTFVLDVVLRGNEEKLAALLIILRFWRIVELMEGEFRTRDFRDGFLTWLGRCGSWCRRTQCRSCGGSGLY